MTAQGARAACIPIRATKTIHGHLLDAAGAPEDALSFSAMQHRTVLPTMHLSARDPECGAMRAISSRKYSCIDDGNIQTMIDLGVITGFDWDEGNARKNEKHGVSTAEAEQVFFDAPLLLLEDGAHSRQETRFHALGQSDERRALHITFTLRCSSQLIRGISARDMSRKERTIYEQAN